MDRNKIAIKSEKLFSWIHIDKDIREKTTIRIWESSKILFWMLIVSVLNLIPAVNAKADTKPDTVRRTFTFYVKSEPQTLDPTMAVSGESSYIHATLFRGLTRFTDEGQLIFDQAERCRYVIDTDLRCKLRKDLKYSDGSPIKAQDYVEAFKKFQTGKHGSYVTNLLSNIKEMSAPSDRDITFIFKEPDFEFMEKLSNSLLFPYKNEAKFNGPYKIEKIEKGKVWHLTPNENFHGGNSKRPPIDILFVPEDSTAVNLYEKGSLDFIWRLPASEISRFKSMPDFLQVPLSRFDYIGFNMRKDSPLADKALRKKLASSVDFEEFKKIFQSLGRPGCPGLSERFLIADDKHCQNFLPSKSVTVNPHVLPSTKTKDFEFGISTLGGDDIKRAAEWYQEQWKKNAGISVQIKAREQKTYVSLLKSNPPTIFRKGVGLSRPTCLAGLESFKSDSPENFSGFKNERFDFMIKSLATRKMSRIEQDMVCGAAVDFLFKEEIVGIPMGRIRYTMLLNPRFKGLKVNELNQLDLSELEYVGGK